MWGGLGPGQAVWNFEPSLLGPFAAAIALRLEDWAGFAEVVAACEEAEESLRRGFTAERFS